MLDADLLKQFRAAAAHYGFTEQDILSLFSQVAGGTAETLEQAAELYKTDEKVRVRIDAYVRIFKPGFQSPCS